MGELEKLAARDSIRHLIASYAAAVDGRDKEAALALFAQDARLNVMGQEIEGSDGVAGWIDSLFASPPGIHLTTNTVIQLTDASTASARSDVAFIKRDENGWKILVAGQYLDTLVNRDGNWLFQGRKIVLS